MKAVVVHQYGGPEVLKLPRNILIPRQVPAKYWCGSQPPV